MRGDVTFSTDVIGDPVIVRSDGRPAYNFAVVIDDVRMAITHVIRGEDHISNTPRQVLIYEALGATPPAFAHLSLVLGPDHAPLSKRHGATSVAEFRERGYLPEALVNYLALLGWSPGENEEILPAARDGAPVRSRDGQPQRGGVRHGQAGVDEPALHEGGRAASASRARRVPYFRARGLRHGARPTYHWSSSQSLLPMAVGSVDRLEEIPGARGVRSSTGTPPGRRRWSRAEPDGARGRAGVCRGGRGRRAAGSRAFRAAAARARERTGLKGRALFHPIRVALTAADSGPELDLAVPAIDRGAALCAGERRAPSASSCAERAATSLRRR